jgi:acyl-CoA reductase-like NAD-dependent aldehyde dehydrogenase
MANDTPYGLAGYVWSGNVERTQGRPATESWERQPQRGPERSQRALPWLQAIRQRPRVGPLRAGGVP